MPHSIPAYRLVNAVANVDVVADAAVRNELLFEHLLCLAQLDLTRGGRALEVEVDDIT